MTNQDNLEDILRSAEKECERRREENIRLRAMLGIQNSTPGESSQTTILVAIFADSRRNDSILSFGLEQTPFGVQPNANWPKFACSKKRNRLKRKSWLPGLDSN